MYVCRSLNSLCIMYLTLKPSMCTIFSLLQRANVVAWMVGMCFVHLKMNNELPTQYLSNVHVYSVIHCNSLYSASLYIYSLLGPVTSLPILLGTNLDLRPISFAYSDKQPLRLCSVVWTEFVCQTDYKSGFSFFMVQRSFWSNIFWFDRP